MTDWTSISVTEEQKELLQAEKPENTAMGKFIVGLLEGDTNDDTEPMQVVPVDEVVGREVPKTTVQLEATEYTKIADELEGRLR